MKYERMFQIIATYFYSFFLYFNDLFAILYM